MYFLSHLVQLIKWIMFLVLQIMLLFMV